MPMRTYRLPSSGGGFGPCLEGLEMGLSGFAGVWVGLTICRRGLGLGLGHV